jgi:hypothetical protein
VFQAGVALGRATPVGEPLVELLLECGPAGVLLAPLLAKPVEEVRFVLGTEQHLGQRLAVDDLGRVALLDV